MGIVREHINFERGRDPKISMGTGISKSIINWLDSRGIASYKINDDYTIDTYSTIMLNSHGLDELPDYIKFNHAYDDAHFNWNNFTNMKNFPRVVHKGFWVNGNPITSLEGIPEVVGGSFSIAKVCGFTEEDIKKVCKVSANEIYLTALVNERTMGELLKKRNWFK